MEQNGESRNGPCKYSQQTFDKGTNTCWREDDQHCDNGGDSAMPMGENEPRYNPCIFES